MILLYPVVFALAVLRFRRSARAGTHGGAGPAWFLVWTAAGALISFSLLTGFSIGLFLLPPAAALLLWVAGVSPRAPEVAGFGAGVGAVLLVLAALNDWSVVFWIGAAAVGLSAGYFSSATWIRTHT